MSERYWKEREGDEFFDDYIDVTDEIAALRAELANMGDAVNVVDHNYREAMTALARADERARRAEAEVAALREQVTELELERIDVNALRTSCICAKECPATEHEYPPIEEDEVLSGLLAERDKERQINDYLVKRTNELEAERDELLSRAREMDDAIARNMLRGDIAEAERDRYRAALADARHIATTGVWDCDPAHCYGDRIVEAIVSVIGTALNGGDDE